MCDKLGPRLGGNKGAIIQQINDRFVLLSENGPMFETLANDYDEPVDQGQEWDYYSYVRKHNPKTDLYSDLSDDEKQKLTKWQKLVLQGKKLGLMYIPSSAAQPEPDDDKEEKSQEGFDNESNGDE